MVMGSAIVLLIYILHGVEGHAWWCSCGTLIPWSFDIWSIHNSQHLFDPYSFSHFLHGILFMGVLTAILPRTSLTQKVIISFFLESTWEIAENSPFIIERYRAATLAVGYAGDTVINSLSDVLFCILGVLVASRLKRTYCIALFCIIEILLLIWFRDNLTLNVLMLLYPIESIRIWQQNGMSIWSVVLQ